MARGTAIPPGKIRGSPASGALLRQCGVSPGALATLLDRACRLGAHPVELALGEGLVAEPRCLAVLARHLGARVQVPPPRPPPMPVDEAFRLGGYALANGTGVLAPQGAQIDLLLRRGARRDHELVLTTRQALLEALVAVDAPRLARRALYTLPESYSARRWGVLLGAQRRLLRLAALAPELLWMLWLWLAPLPALVLPPLLISPLFLCASLAVLTAALESLRPPRRAPRLDPGTLPRYTLLVPLHREARIVPKLVARLMALQYPRDRLEVFYLVEADDHETATALRKQALPFGHFILGLPGGGPRTKPRALNIALPFARGDLVVAYDAEDAPEPDQLLRAAALFAALPGHVACLQGRLAIANHRDGFLTRRFAVDYAALFDCIKAGMGRAAWPVPLGGTSNHFRAAILRRVGAWDAWNVTEDADLGLRLTRFGYRIEDLPSTTWEEAPNIARSWMNQRTRWMKGWMQTLLVHLSTPRTAIRQIGLFRFAMISSTGLSLILGALLYPMLLIGILVRLAQPVPLGATTGLLLLADCALVMALALMLIVELVPASLALISRGAPRLILMVPLAPVTHLLITIAAWRALFELIRQPFFWHKTEHGLTRSDERLGPLRNKARKPPS